MAASAKPAAKKAKPTAPSLAGAIKAAPKLVAAKAARLRLDRWLQEIAGKKAGKALLALLDISPKARDLLTGIAEASPYLWDLAHADPQRLAGLLAADPEARFAALIEDLARIVPAARDEAEAMRLLRCAKAEIALLIAFADIGGVWPMARVTHALTEFADTAIAAALRFLLNGLVAQGRLAPPDRSLPEQGSGFVVLAMGKMGAFELNYSSDIDLIVLFDAEARALAEGTDAAPLYIRLTRALAKMLQERTVDGYVFRVDLRLRPDPGMTQIALSTTAALGYYESVGQNWERAAMIKARPCAGDIAVGDAFLKELTPFVWRKYLDYVAVSDVHAMKRQIHAYKGHDEIAIEGHNVKLGRGGIREIEFFVQTQQLIAGGRNPALRRRDTLGVLSILAEGGWIAAGTAQELAAAYGFLRMVEHRLQMIADEQTHTLPEDSEAIGRFARFLGFPGRDAFAAELGGHLRTVERHYSQLFEDTPSPVGVRRPLVFPAGDHDRGTIDRLAELGFRQPVEASATIRRWLSGAYRSLKGEVARAHLSELIPLLADHLVRAENPDVALVALDRFLGALHGGARFYSLLRQNPDMVVLLVLILGTAPRLADVLALQPDTMDALLDPAFFGILPDQGKVERALKLSLDQSQSFEDMLDRARMFGREQMFLVGVRVLSGTVSGEQAGEAFARLADVLIDTMHHAVAAKIAAAHGRLRRQESAVLALGKLGGREMTAGSDLDLILVYDFDQDHPESDGARPLYGAQYFARLTQRLISALTTPTNYGALYEVDMRLRPSGRSGPVATQIDGFRGYQEAEAWTWEHMALTRARVVSGGPAFAARVERVIRDVLCAPRDVETVAGDVVEMRRAIAQEKGDEDRWNLKYAAGGMIDLDFVAQYLQLVYAHEKPEILDTGTARVLDKAWRLGVLATGDAEILRAAARLYNNLTQILRLCLSGPFDPKAAGPGLLNLLARAGDMPDFATLDAHLIETQARVRASFTRILGEAP